MNIQLNDGRVLVKSKGDVEKTAGGIFIPQNVNREQPISVGTVVNAGHPRTDSAGKPTSMEFAKGDQVLFSSLGTVQVTVDGEKLMLVRHEDIVAKVWDTQVEPGFVVENAVGRGT